ncbi:hypothetical protein [Streptomyces parvus]|uniref:hypothetical protein n=1 Tax=Streptomyces parvus TaxID=66428 RepID=UPI0035E27778
MPKKRKKDRKASRAPRVLRVPQVPHGEADPGAAAFDFPDTALRSRFSTPADAVSAVRSGKTVEWTGSNDGSSMRHRLLTADDGTAVVEQAVFLGGLQESMILCAWHETPEQERPGLEKRIFGALDDLHTAVRTVLEEDIRTLRSDGSDDYTAPVPEAFCEAPERHGAGIPLFGWRVLHPVTAGTTWEDTVDPATWNSSEVIGGWSGDFDHIDVVRPEGFAGLLRRCGVPIVLCALCGDPITSRHPRWPGVWTGPRGDGPLCDAAASAAPKPLHGWYTDSMFGAPHQPRK